jgi:hypothetical protein
MSKTTTHRPPSIIERSIVRPLAIWVLAAPATLVLATFLIILRPQTSIDELTAATALPFVALYLMARMIGVFVGMPSEDQRAELAELKRRTPHGIKTLVDVQGFLLTLASIAIASSIFYAILGMSWAWPMAMKIAGILIGVAAVVSILCGFEIMSHENHNAGFIARCHAMFLLLSDRITQVSGRITGSFARRTALHSVRP